MEINKDFSRIGGNSLYVIIGKKLKQLGIYLTELGERIIVVGKPLQITNVTSSFISYCSILLNFTVNRSNENGVISNDKVQLILTSNDYKEAYKNKKEDNSLNLTEEEVLIIIRDNIKLWHIKE